MKRLFLVPIAGAIVVAGGMLVADPSTYYRVLLVTAAFATAVSAFLTMRCFTPGDKLFAGWLLLGGGYAVAGLRHLLRVIALASGTDLVGRGVADTMLVLQNLLVALSLWMFVMSWRATGLAVPVSRGFAIFWTAGGIAVAVLAGVFPLMQGMATVSANSVLLVSTLGDVIGIALIAPLAMSALALRGGLLMHTWMYLAASETFWLAYDVWLAIRPAAGVSPSAGNGVEQVIRMIAVLLAFAATVAQRRAIKPVRTLVQPAPLPAT